MYEWLALSDYPDLATSVAGTGLLQKGALIMEIALPISGPKVLLDYRRTDGWERRLSVFYDAATGMGLLHRQGDSVVRHMIKGPLPQDRGTARLTLRWDGPAREWSLVFEHLNSGLVLTSHGFAPLPLPMDDLSALSRGDGTQYRHPGLLWFGVTRGANPPYHAPWVGLRTPILTDRGYRMAGHLKSGDRVMTRDQGALPLQQVRRMDLPSRGHFTPILLRAPYFGTTCDILVSANQMIALAGSEVEYLFGDDEVLAEARHLIDGRSALPDTRRAVTSCVALDTGPMALLISDGFVLASMPAVALPSAHLPRRPLHSYEAVPLLALLGRGNRARAA